MSVSYLERKGEPSGTIFVIVVTASGWDGEFRWEGYADLIADALVKAQLDFDERRSALFPDSEVDQLIGD